MPRDPRKIPLSQAAARRESRSCHRCDLWKLGTQNAVKHFKWEPRGKPFPSPLAPIVTLTVHPSSILRAPDSASRADARRQFVADLTTIARMLRR